MSKTQLPPELVEKITQAFLKRKCKNHHCSRGAIKKKDCLVCNGNEYLDFPEKCAQIAADYAEEENKDKSLMLNKNYEYMEELAMLLPSEYWTNQFREKWNSHMTDLEQLLKKHEDGE